MSDDIARILDGIDQTETESENGWWETSTGAEFGAERLAEIKAMFDQLQADNEALRARMAELTGHAAIQNELIQEMVYTEATTGRKSIADSIETHGKAWLLRKQAEAMEGAIDSSYGFTQMAQLLRTQAAELERQTVEGEVK